jgi:hypothetical protein
VICIPFEFGEQGAADPLAGFKFNDQKVSDAADVPQVSTDGWPAPNGGHHEIPTTF